MYIQNKVCDSIHGQPPPKRLRQPRAHTSNTSYKYPVARITIILITSTISTPVKDAYNTKPSYHLAETANTHAQSANRIAFVPLYQTYQTVRFPLPSKTRVFIESIKAYLHTEQAPGL